MLPRTYQLAGSFIWFVDIINVICYVVYLYIIMLVWCFKVVCRSSDSRFSSFGISSIPSCPCRRHIVTMATEFGGRTGSRVRVQMLYLVLILLTTLRSAVFLWQRWRRVVQAVDVIVHIIIIISIYMLLNTSDKYCIVLLYLVSEFIFIDIFRQSFFFKHYILWPCHRAKVGYPRVLLVWVRYDIAIFYFTESYLRQNNCFYL